jgi:integrase
MVRLARDARGNYRARKRLPDDVREEYGRRHGPRLEAKFFAPASTNPHEAKQQFRDWANEVEGRIIAIRAARDGTGQSLTPQQARALAAEWYEWWIGRHQQATARQVGQWRDAVHDAIYSSTTDVSEHDAERFDADEMWEDRSAVRDNVRPVLADVGETAQFLAAKQLVPTQAARNLFLDYLYADLSAALNRLMRLRAGDYGVDAYAERFPKSAPAPDSGATPWELFKVWIEKKNPAESSIESWRYVFQAMEKHFKGRSAASILPEEADAWIQGLINEDRSPHYIKKTYLTACKTVFGMAVRQKRIARNPFADVIVELPKKAKVRETKAFYPEEWRVILAGALSVPDVSSPDDAAKRWVPWLCAYTGARPSEITQLRREDVVRRDGIAALRITPEAGTVKTKQTNVVPIHEHVINQGFLAFVEVRKPGPLFYRPRDDRQPAAARDRTRQTKKPWFQATQRLAAWVRELGVTDTNIRPNHAWRHTFKQIADRHGISERTSDYITGHAGKSTGARYGAPTLEDMAAALRKFPRYVIKQ